MALPVTFGPLTAASMGQLDQDFAAVGALTTIQCSATGTNAIVLTPVANQPTVSGYGLPNPLKFGFIAPASSSNTVTLEVAALGFLPAYTQNGVQATSGTLIGGNYYEVTYTTGAIYNAGAGAWVLSSYQPATGAAAVSSASVSGLSISNNAGASSTSVDVTFSRACLVSVVGAPAFVASGSFTIDLTAGTTTPAANGMDGEARPTSGWVYLYAISTGSGSAGLGTTVSPLAGPPTLPAGYSFYGYIGAMRCDGSSNLLRSRQLGSNVTYTVTAATNTAAYPIIASGSGGTLNASTFTGVAEAIGSFVPPTASLLKFVLGCPSAGGAEIAAVAPNANFAGYGSTTNPVPWSSNNLGLSVSSAPQVGEILLETTNIYYACSGSDGRLQAMGWRDYVTAG